MKDNKSASLFPKEQVIESLKQIIRETEPTNDDKESIMFTVEVATVVMLLVTLYSIVNSSQVRLLTTLPCLSFCLSLCCLPILPKLLQSTW